MRFQCQWVAINSCFAVAVILAGCTATTGPETEPVSGTVTLDGQPLEGAQVVFQPKSGGRAASGTTNAQGKFKLTTFNPQDGAMIGSYAVMISKVESESAANVDTSGLSEEEATKKAAEAYYSSAAAKNAGSPLAKDASKDLIPATYKDAKTSGLTADVKEGGGDFEFKLSST